ncbi:MAG TPA: ATP-binding cassette domain-containing protein [Anaerolineae bacterium]|nr:ATP-binding cassette domain-containing protein [Anaerolineae bacterium]
MTDAGRIVVLLGPRAAGKTDALLSLSGLVASPAIDDRLKSIVQGSQSISLCSHQRLPHSRLTVRENAQLMAALHGSVARTRIEALLRSSALATISNQPVYLLPRQLSRMLNVVCALLPDADVLLVDDVTGGLSMPAQRQLCQFILEEQRRQPRTLLFATRELFVAQALGGEVWLFDHGEVVQQWQPGELPTALFQLAAYHIELMTPAAAHQLNNRLAAQPDFVRSVQQVDARTVRVVIDQASSLLCLVEMAGRSLLNFHALPLEADDLLTQWQAAGKESTHSIPAAAVSIGDRQTASAPHEIKSLQQPWQAIRQLMLAEWRTHFRRLWGFGNIVLSGVVILSMFQLILQEFSLGRLVTWAPLGLLVSSNLALGFAAESAVYLTRVADVETLFEPAQTISAMSRLSLLALYDLTPIGRVSVLLGLVLGQGLVLLCHAVMPLVCWIIVLTAIEQGWELIISSIVFWSFTAIDSLALAVWVSQFVHRPGWSRWLGWFLWLSVTLTIAVASSEHPITWLWPYAGFTVAFRNLFTQPILVFAPFGMALLGTLVLCALALRSFRRQRAVHAAQMRAADE